jgi:hypothetical protein
VSRWVEEELNGTRFKDKRLCKRFMLIVDRLVERPEASLPQAMASWAETKAAYRFLDSDKVTPKAIRASHIHSTAQRALQSGKVLIIQDTTTLDFTDHGETAGLGYLDYPLHQGLLLHSALCCTCAGVPLGLLDQQMWIRNPEERGKTQYRAQRLIKDKESAKWIRTLKGSLESVAESVATVTIADREADIYELLVAPRPAKADLLIRACRERRVKINEEVDHLWPVMLTSSVRGKISIEVEANPKRKPRTAICSLHFEKVWVLPPRAAKQKEALSLWAILVREDAVPEGVEPLEWLLLTTLRVENLEEALQYVKWYSLRWLIERYHLVLKSGCRVEKLQLETEERLERAIAVYSIVAWRLLWLTYNARQFPEASCEIALERHEWQALYCKIKKTPIAPEEPPSLRQAVRWIAQLGGFLGRKSDGEPGVMVIWRGWRRLEDIADDWLTFRAPQKDVGNA